MSKREQGAPFLHADSMRSRCGRDRPGAGAKKRSASTPEAHVVGCEPAVGEADPVSHNAAATAAGEPSKTNSPKINRRRRGPKRGPDSRAPLARARMSKREQGAPFLHADSMRSRCGRDRPGAGAKKRSASTPEAHVVGCEPAVGEADPVSHNAAATAAGEPSKTNSPKINRRRRGPKRGPDSRAPRARARMSKREQGAPFLHADSMRSRCGRDRPGAGAKKRSASTPEAHVVGCEPAVGEADPVSHNAAATAAGEPSKTNSPKINRRRRGPKRGPDSRAPRARAYEQA